MYWIDNDEFLFKCRPSWGHCPPVKEIESTVSQLNEALGEGIEHIDSRSYYAFREKCKQIKRPNGLWRFRIFDRQSRRIQRRTLVSSTGTSDYMDYVITALNSPVDETLRLNTLRSLTLIQVTEDGTIDLEGDMDLAKFDASVFIGALRPLYRYPKFIIG